MSTDTSVQESGKTNNRLVTRLATRFHDGILLGLFPEPEGEGYMFFRNVS
jgi:hypothetical protein